VARSFNVWATTADGQFKAVTAPGSVANDPKVVFDLGPRQIDATLFHKALITINYDGPWGLGDGPGGGLVGRIVWVTQDGRTEQVSLPIVMLTGLHTYIVALRTVPATAYVDPAGNSAFVGWGTGAATFVSQFRFDPHEDPGARSWQIYDVQLLRDEAVDPTFPIHFQDNTWASGTSANLYADTDRDAGNGLGTLIASNVAVGAGVNTFNWNGGGVGPGAYWIHAELTRSGRTVASTSTGQLDVALGGAGAPPGPPGAAPAAAPSDANARLYAFFVWLVRSLNACQTAQRRHQKAIYNTPFCRSLLAAAARSRKVVKKRR